MIAAGPLIAVAGSPAGVRGGLTSPWLIGKSTVIGHGAAATVMFDHPFFVGGGRGLILSWSCHPFTWILWRNSP
jgi:hypothetical protein